MIFAKCKRKINMNSLKTPKKSMSYFSMASPITKDPVNCFMTVL